MTERLAGQIALVTGAGGDIGRAILHRLLDEGATVAITDTNLELLSRAQAALSPPQAARTSIHPLDVRSDASCAIVVADVTARWGGLDILVNAAGIMVRSSALDTDTAAFQAILDVNLTGAYRMAKASHAALLKSARPNIVSVSSTHAFLAAKNSIAYSTSKAALSHLTRLLALEWAADGIRVNAVAPTVVPSAMTADVLADPEYIARKMGSIPLGKPIATAHVAAAIAYLCSPDGDSTTGQILVLDGGESLA